MHNELTQLILSVDAVIDLTKQGHFFDVSSESIQDKSKADLLAKGLVVFQVSWLVVQSVARAYFHYPLSLLEVHTMVHVFCAMMVYSLWWHKPKDMNAPTLINSAHCQGSIEETLVRSW